MPLAILRTNLARAKVSKHFKTQLVEKISEVLCKPAGRILVVVEPDQDMALGTSDDPTCWLIVHSIGVFSPEKNPFIGEAFQGFIEQELKVPKQRILVTLRDLPEADASTLHTMKW